MEPLYQELDKNLYKKYDATYISDASPNGGSSAISTGILPVVPAGQVTDVVDPNNIISGSIAGNLEYTGGYIQSANYVANTSGWRLDSNGSLYAVNASLSGSITATSGTIGGFTITSTALQTAASGDRVVMSSSDKSFSVYDSSAIVARVGINSGFGIQLTPTSVTNNGMSISTAQAGLGISYSNTTNVAATALRIVQTSTGANNNLSAVNIDYAGSLGAVQIANSGTGRSIYMVDSGSTGSVEAVLLTYARSGRAIDLTTSNAAATGLYISSVSTSNAAIDVTVNTSSGNPVGMRLNINNSGGNEYAFEFAGAEVVSAAVGGVQGKKLRVIIGGGVYFIPFYDA